MFQVSWISIEENIEVGDAFVDFAESCHNLQYYVQSVRKPL